MRDVGSSDDSVRARIPAPALLVKDFVNTIDIAGGADQLDSPAALALWVDTHQLARGAARPLSASDLRLATGVREGLRQLLRINAGHEPSAEALERFNAGLGSMPLLARYDTSGQAEWVSIRAAGVTPALVELLACVDRAKQEHSWSRLKACARDECQWAYYDTSRNHSGRWCSMIDCGNRVKMRRAHATRSRRRQGS